MERVRETSSRIRAQNGGRILIILVGTRTRSGRLRGKLGIRIHNYSFLTKLRNRVYFNVNIVLNMVCYISRINRVPHSNQLNIYIYKCQKSESMQRERERETKRKKSFEDYARFLLHFRENCKKRNRKIYIFLFIQ